MPCGFVHWMRMQFIRFVFIYLLFGRQQSTWLSSVDIGNVNEHRSHANREREVRRTRTRMQSKEAKNGKWKTAAYSFQAEKVGAFPVVATAGNAIRFNDSWNEHQQRNDFCFTLRTSSTLGRKCGQWNFMQTTIILYLDLSLNPPNTFLMARQSHTLSINSLTFSFGSQNVVDYNL